MSLFTFVLLDKALIQIEVQSALALALTSLIQFEILQDAVLDYDKAGLPALEDGWAKLLQISFLARWFLIDVHQGLL